MSDAVSAVSAWEGQGTVHCRYRPALASGFVGMNW
jgi:hypothetical protein